MQTTLQQMRKNYGWTQNDLSTRSGIPRKRISAFEQGVLGVPPEELRALSDAFGRDPRELDVLPARATGGQPKPGRELLARHRCGPAPAPAPRFNGEGRLGACRSRHPRVLARLEPLIASSQDFQLFLREAASDSRPETMFHLFELERGARFCRVSIAEIGYELRPVIEYFTRLAIGARALPALVTPEWLLIPQVTVLSPWRYTMDGLLVVQQPRRTFINLEIDGRGHDHSGDTERTARLSMPTLRITENEVLENVSLTTRLRAIGYCLP
jgi:transcriptional regulator with XRE-family HTH domain